MAEVIEPAEQVGMLADYQILALVLLYLYNS